MSAANKNASPALKSEIMLQINQKLWEKGVISRGVYESAMVKIVASHPEVKPSGCCCLLPKRAN